MSAILPLASILRETDMQMRTAGLDPAVVADYAEAMEEGTTFPPVVIFSDGTSFWLADGFHRTEAAIKIERETIEADVRQGTRRDAILFAAGANAKHGMRRTQADKRRAVTTLLSDPQFANESDRAVGKACAVDHKTVATIRRELRGEIPTGKATAAAAVSVSRAVGISPSDVAAASMVERLLAKATDASLLAECQRRGWEVANAH